MKRKEHSLLYHTMHSRPMPGCLPLFFIFALAVSALVVWFVPVRMPERVRPAGAGQVYLKSGRLADFVIRRESPLPLHLPMHVDPEYQEDAAAASMTLLRPVKILPPPPQPLFDGAPDSAVLNAESLLVLPGQEIVEEPAQQPVPSTIHSSAETPVFHPGVETETDADSEEVQP